MNIKFLLPFAAAIAFVACSDESSSTAPEQTPESSAVVPASSETLPPESSAAEPLSSEALPGSSEALPASSETVPASSASVGGIDPVPPAVDGPYDPTKQYVFYGAELTGLEKFHYGRFEARMKMAATSGTVSSMFLYYNESYLKKEEPWNEIDIEILGKDPTKWQSNIITREGDPTISKTTTSEVIHPFNYDATNEFHLYAIIWTPEYIAWEVDSVEVRRDTLGMSRGTHADGDQVKFMTEEQTLRFNLWSSNSTSWVGKFAPENLPIEQHIDYVRVYSYNEATKDFTLSWQDDFDGVALDYSRWSEGNWEMERVQYRDLNIRVENGYAKLRLDYEFK